jgi:rhodanese-related sulfurtransferase
MKPQELKEKIDARENLLLLDVREPEEVQYEPSLPGAVHMPMGKVFIEASQGTLPKDKKIVTVCKTGGRCGIITRELSEKGYDIEELEGGMNAWQDTYS